MSEWHDKFQAHLEACSQCRDNPIVLCKIGDHYLKMGALTPQKSLAEEVLEILDKHGKNAMAEIREHIAKNEVVDK